MPKECQHVPLIVGHPFTEQSHVQIISTSDKLSIQNLNPIFNNTQTVNKTVFKVNDDCNIPSNYLGFIAVKCDFPNFELCIEGGIREEYAIPRCLVKSDYNGDSILPILNISNNDLNFKKGIDIARAEQCEEGEIKNEKGNIDNDNKNYNREVNKQNVTLSELNTELKGSDAQRLVSLLNEYKDVIARNMKQLGVTNKIKMKIDLMSDKPIYFKPYRLSFYERSQVRDIIKELKECDIIEDSVSQYASPCLIVKKKTGDVRLCVDYRALNKITVKDHYQLSRIDDQIDMLHNKKFFTSL